MTTIALLDDDPDEYLLLSDAFAILKIPVDLVQFLRFPELMRYLAQANALPDMLLLDVDMPGLNGLDVLRLLKSEPRISMMPIVMHSGTSDPAIIDTCFKGGATAFLKKAGNMQTRLHHLCILLSWNTQVIFSLPSALMMS